MNKNSSLLKGLLLGFTLSSVLFAGIPAFAEGAVENIEVALNSINLIVNGKKVAADNILYNCTTYVPIRAVAEMMWENVVWDEESNTAGIFDKDYKPSDSSSFNPEILDKVPKQVSIKSAYWGGDSNIPADFSKHVGPNEFVVISDTWENTSADYSVSSSIIDAFQQLCDRELILSAVGHPDVKVNFYPTANYGSSPTKNGWITMWKITVQDSSLKNIVSGVKYKLIPSNNSEYKWVVKDDVYLIKP